MPVNDKDKNDKKIHPSKKRIVKEESPADLIPETEIKNPPTDNMETTMPETTTNENVAEETPAAEKAETTYQPLIEDEPIQSDEDLLKIKNESADYSPLSSERVDREYASKDQTNQPVVDRVPEEEIKTQPTTGTGSGTGTPTDTKSGSSGTAPAPEKANPDMTGLTPDEQRESSTMLVDALLGGYRQLWGGAAWLVTVGENQVMQWTMEDKLSDEMVIPCGKNGEQITVQQFFSDFDEAVTEAGEIPEDHFKPVRESMIREFTRRGWGISDMQNILQFFARDAVQRTGNFYALYRQRVQNTNQLFDLWKQQKEILQKQEEAASTPEAGK